MVLPLRELVLRLGGRTVTPLGCVFFVVCLSAFDWTCVRTGSGFARVGDVSPRVKDTFENDGTAILVAAFVTSTRYRWLWKWTAACTCDYQSEGWRGRMSSPYDALNDNATHRALLLANLATWHTVRFTHHFRKAILHPETLQAGNAVDSKKGMILRARCRHELNPASKHSVGQNRLASLELATVFLTSAIAHEMQKRTAAAPPRRGFEQTPAVLRLLRSPRSYPWRP